MSEAEVSPVPLKVTLTAAGFLPDVALHRRQGKWIQEASYSNLWFAFAMFVAAAICCFIPWEERARGVFGNGPKVVYIIAAGFIWGSLCTVAAFFLRNWMGQTVILDPIAKTISIDHPDLSAVIPWARVVGIQICGGGASAYQANLVFRNTSNEVIRHCLCSHVVRRYCELLATAYCNNGSFSLIDHGA